MRATRRGSATRDVRFARIKARQPLAPAVAAGTSAVGRLSGTTPTPSPRLCRCSGLPPKPISSQKEAFSQPHTPVQRKAARQSSESVGVGVGCVWARLTWLSAFDVARKAELEEERERLRVEMEAAAATAPVTLAVSAASRAPPMLTEPTSQGWHPGCGCSRLRASPVTTISSLDSPLAGSPVENALHSAHCSFRSARWRERAQSLGSVRYERTQPLDSTCRRERARSLDSMVDTLRNARATPPYRRITPASPKGAPPAAMGSIRGAEMDAISQSSLAIALGAARSFAAGGVQAQRLGSASPVTIAPTVLPSVPSSSHVAPVDQTDAHRRSLMQRPIALVKIVSGTELVLD